MADFRWIQVSLFVIAALQFTAAAELPPFFTFRAGQEVTLPCENVIDGQQNCNSTTWSFINPRQTAAVELIKLGQIDDTSNSDRLSVTQNCSLVIKKVTDEDVGRYDCQQWKSGQRQTPDSVVHLSVVTMTERRISDQVVWLCSVRPYDRWCPHSVKWLYAGKDVDEENILQTSQSGCSASVTFKTPHFSHTSNSDLLECEVTDGNKVQQQFPFRLQASGEKPGDDTTKPEPGPKTRTPPRTTRPEPKTRPPPRKPRSEPKTRAPSPATPRSEPKTRAPPPTTPRSEPKSRAPPPTTPRSEPKSRAPPPTTPRSEPKSRAPSPATPRSEPKTRAPPPTTPRSEPKSRAPPPTPPRSEPKSRAPTDSGMKRGTITTASAIYDDSTNLDESLYVDLWRFIIVSVGLAALIIIVVAVSVWTRAKGRKIQMDENMVDDDEDDGAVNYENVTSSV